MKTMLLRNQYLDEIGILFFIITHQNINLFFPRRGTGIMV
jgi:hypothetical protein